MGKLTNEQQKILNIISKYGCLHIEQAYQLLNPTPPHITSILINMLVKNEYIKLMQDKYLVAKNSSKGVNHDTIACIWTMIKLAKSNEEIFESMKAVAPATIYFVRDNKESFEIIPLNETNLIAIRNMQDMILEKNKQFEEIADNWYVFVIDNKEIVGKIKKCELRFPFIVALHEGKDQEGIPSIRFMKSIPKKCE
ncbi:MAG: DUF5697 family protein [Lachnospiraceae bacterium]|nr:DUF5697 family protein [Lachnospiraceae bacterium]